MPDWKIRYDPDFMQSPMTPWVHKRLDDGDGGPAVYAPPRPLPIPDKGYATFTIVFERFPFTFASLHELDEAIRVMELETLPQIEIPRKKQLPVYRKLDPHGAQSKHWMQRIPKGMQSWARRRKIAFALKQGRTAIKKALGPANVARSYGQTDPTPSSKEQP